MAKNKILKGTKIFIKDLAFKRSLKKVKKMKPKDTNKIIGKIAKKDIKPDAILKKSLFKK